MTVLSPVFRQRFFDNDGSPLDAGKVYFYEAGTSTPKNTYTDNTLSDPNTNPVILDSNGYADIWLIPNEFYKVVLATSADVILWTVDNVSVGDNGGSGFTFDAVDNVADLKALTPPSSGSAIVQVLGYYQPPGNTVNGYTQKADAGGGLFYWDSNSVLADDGGVVFIPDSAPATGRWIRVFDGPVDINWFGAYPDYILDNGTVNPSPTPNEAFVNLASSYARANDSRVNVPSGIYLMSGALVTGVSIVGDQKPLITTDLPYGSVSWGANPGGDAIEGPIFIWDRTLGPGDIYLQNAAAESSENVQFKNIGFMSKSFIGTGGGTLLVSSSDQTVTTNYDFGSLPTFEDCIICNFNIGIRVETSASANYGSVEFKGCAQTMSFGVISTDIAANQNINGSSFINCGTALIPFIKIENAMGVNFNQCFFDKTSTIGIRLNGGTGLSLNQCSYSHQKNSSGPSGITSQFITATAEASANAGLISIYKTLGGTDAGDIDLSLSPVAPKLTIMDSNLKSDTNGTNLILGASFLNEFGFINYGTITGTAIPNKVTTDEAHLQGIRFEVNGDLRDIGLVDTTNTKVLRLTATETGATSDGAKIEMFGNAYGAGTADLNLFAGSGSNKGDINLTTEPFKSVNIPQKLDVSELDVFVITSDVHITVTDKSFGLKSAQVTASANGYFSGRVDLVAGSVTVTCDNAHIGDAIFLSNTFHTGGTTPGFLRVSAVVEGVSFTITSSSANDDSTICWMIIKST